MRMNERISVVAAFGMPYKLRPVRFRWAGRVREVREVTYTWQSISGKSKLYHFAITDANESAYELSFDASDLVWLMTGVEEPA